MSQMGEQTLAKIKLKVNTICFNAFYKLSEMIVIWGKTELELIANLLFNPVMSTWYL